MGFGIRPNNPILSIQTATVTGHDGTVGPPSTWTYGITLEDGGSEMGVGVLFARSANIEYDAIPNDTVVPVIYINNGWKIIYNELEAEEDCGA